MGEILNPGFIGLAVPLIALFVMGCIVKVIFCIAERIGK
jgi:hypothetical protein